LPQGSRGRCHVQRGLIDNNKGLVCFIYPTDAKANWIQWGCEYQLEKQLEWEASIRNKSVANIRRCAWGCLRLFLDNKQEKVFWEGIREWEEFGKKK